MNQGASDGFSSLEDLDFADNLALLSHTHQNMEEKTDKLRSFAQKVGLQISQTKTEVMTLSVINLAPVTVKFSLSDLPMTDSFTYLSRVIRQDGGAGSDIQSSLNKTRNVFCSMNSV